MVIKKKPYELVKITWLDHVGDDSWVAAETLADTQPAEIVTVGYLINETKTYYSVASSIDMATENVTHGMTIIKKCVIKMEKL